MKPFLLLLLCYLRFTLFAQTAPEPTYNIKGITADSATMKTLDLTTIGLKTDKIIAVNSSLSKSDG